MRKRLIALVLSIVLVLSMLSDVAYAVGRTDGTVKRSATKTALNVGKTIEITNTPTDGWFTSKLVGGQVVPGTVFEIATVSDLLALPGIVNEQRVTFDGCTVKLTSAVYDLNPSWTLGQDLPEGANLWTPIGIHQDIVMFKGIFTGEYEPGKYATIRGLYMSYSGDNASGFFGDFQGTARNLKFENSYFNSSKMMLGAVTGRLAGGENNESDKGSVYNIYVADSVQVVCTANDGVVGGIVGRFSSQIQPAGQSRIVLRAHALKNCWFDGTVEGKTRVGGLVGQVFWNSSDKVLVDDCLFTGIVKASEKSAGGILGHDWDSPVYKNSVSNGIVCCGTGTNLGPVVGEGGNSSGNNTYALAKVYKLDGVTENTISNTKGYIAKTATQLKTCEGLSLNFWSESNTTGVWVVTDNGPELAMFTDRVLNLTLTKVPTKSTYVQGQPLDLEGAEVLLEYQGGKCETVSLVELEGVELIYDNMLTGDVFVSIIYQESVGSVFTITVNPRVLTHISVEPPTKVSYIEGQELDLTGGAVRVWFESDDNYSELIPLTEDMISGFDNSTIGTQSITVTYQGYETNFEVNIAPKSAVHMEMQDWPNKVCYKQGATSVDVTGATAIVWYDNDTHEIITITNEMVTNFDSSTLGFTYVEITYGNAVTYFDVLITDMYIYSQEQATTVGKTIQVPIYINNPSGFSYLKLKVGYDRSALELVGIENQSLFNGSFLPSESIETTPQVLLWASANDTAESGCIAMLTFRVLDDALSGTYNVDISFSEACNSAREDVYFATESTTIVVNDYIIGDVNGDDVVNGKDATLLLQYLADWDVEINTETSDMNEDGDVNGQDVVLLMKCLAGWQ